MPVLIRIIGIAAIAAGIVFLFRPEAMKSLTRFLRRGKRIYGMGVLRLLIGSVFLLGASRCRLPGAVIALGVLSLAGGIVIFFLGSNRLNSLLEWEQNRSTAVLRLFALAAITVGAIVVICA